MISSRILWLQVQCLKDDMFPWKKLEKTRGFSIVTSKMTLRRSPVVQVACPFRLWPAPDSGDLFRKTRKKWNSWCFFIGKIWQTWHIYCKKHGVNISGLVLLGKWKSGASCWNSQKKKIEDSGFEDGWSALQLAPFLTQGRIPTKD